METTAPALTVTHRSVVTEDQIDHLGHMNVRFYGVNATAGMRALLTALGAPTDRRVRLVDVYTRHHREQMLGTHLVVRSGVVDATDGELVLYHELSNEQTDVLAATFVHRVRLDGTVGEAADLPAELAAQARAATIAIPPHGATRSISLGADLIASAPTRAELSARGLAIRKVRAITPEECNPDGAYNASMAAMLLWGGESFDTRSPEALLQGPNGERMGWASMETRLSVRRLPQRGDRIQSFSAVIGIADKILHHLMWSFDVEADELLVTFEIVNLAFDTVSRRPMQIPDRIRAAETALLQTDLAPRPVA